MDEMKTLTINGKTYEVTDPDAPVKDVVSQGRNAKYTFTSPGWKRVLNIIRTSGGMVNFGISNANPLYMSQAAGICFGGFVEYKDDTSSSGQPMLYQLYNNVFGADYSRGDLEITAVRIGYPDPDQEPYDNGTSGDARVNPVNCYLDIKVEFNETALNNGTISFNMNYAGFADSHNCQAITEETNATDTGMYGERLFFHEMNLHYGAMLYVPDGKADLPGYLRAGDGTKTIGIPGLSTGQYGFKTNSTGTTLLPAMATNGEIEAGTNQYKPIVPSNLEYAVRYVGDNVYLEKPYTEPEIGKILKVLSVNEDGTFTCTWGDAPVAGVSDVQIGANSIVTDGVAKMRVSSSYGTSVVNNNMLATYPADNTNISNRGAKYMPITTTNYDYTVKSAMCDGKGAAWTSDEQAAAQQRMGIENAGRKLDILWKLNEGISYDFISDTSERYAKTVPTGCKFASIEHIGGHTEVVDGESVSADVQSVKEQGFNWWDETWEKGALNVENGNTVNDTGCFRSKDFIPVLPSTNYYFCVNTETTGQAIRVVYYDKNQAFIKSPGADTNAIKQTPENCYFVKFYSRVSPTVYNGGICINVSNPARNGTYEPYQTKTYTVPDAVRALPGYGWSAGDVCNSIERTETGWQYVQRVDLPITDTGYTVLDEPIVTDITDLMADFPDNFSVEAENTIIFENAALMSVPNTVKYLRSLKEVSA